MLDDDLIETANTWSQQQILTAIAHPGQESSHIVHGLPFEPERSHIASILDATTMTTLTLKNFPDDLYARLKARAAEHRRSLNREAILCLEDAVATASPARTEATLTALRKNRLKLNRIFLTDRDLAAARSAGRA